jgi:transcription-repair coupling factor (superfamily II helicase)
MSLMGVRDLSIIETPPEGRLAVRTYVTRFDEGTIYEAITRELERGGQVFFVHNRVDSIDGIELRLKRLLPHARIVVGHGQMKERELEQVMLQFINKEADILVSTTIIESGLDMPSVNTMIINRAHTFGLSQLYQLRGRIGRSKNRAYAYLLVPDQKILPPDARKRLRAIQDLTDVGAGFRLAAHDLEIRGAGNLLGAEQSGHIAALGFDLYCKTIQDTVREMKGEPPETEFHPKIDMNESAFFPEDYIPDMKQRLEMYKRLMSVPDLGKLLDVEEEIEDRYGRLPGPARNIVSLAELNLIGTQLRVSQIKAIEHMVKILLDDHSPVTEAQLKSVIQEGKGSIKPTKSAPGLVLDVKGLRATEKLDYVRKTLQKLQNNKISDIKSKELYLTSA